MEKSFAKFIEAIDPSQKPDPEQMPPLVLAYIGDSVYDLYIKSMLVSSLKANVHQLHKYSVSFVMAHAQSEIIHKITSILTEHEQYIVKRGRNAKSGTIPKNANVTEYKYATGFEALIGYLYLKNDTERLMEILKLSVDIIKNILKNEGQNYGQEKEHKSQQ